MLRIGRLSWALAIAGAAVVAVSCGSSGDTMGTGGSGGSGGATVSSSSEASGSRGPSSSAGGGMDCPATMGTAMAISKLTFGQGDSGQWKTFGFDLDGKKSTEKSTDLCIPAAAASTDIPYPDGVNGIDNSFGKNLLPEIVALYKTWPQDVNTAIGEGDFNALIKMYCVPKKGDVAKMTTKVFGGTPLVPAPKWDGKDKWPVAPELLADTSDPESSTIVFQNSSIKGQMFDSGKGQEFILTVPMKSKTRSAEIKLVLHSAHVTMKLSADRKSATGGMIGGVLDTEEFVNEVYKIGYVFDLCDEDLFDDVITLVRQSSDILNDGTQDPTQVCNGISIGLGFEMQEVQIGDVGPAPPPGMACDPPMN